MDPDFPDSEIHKPAPLRRRLFSLSVVSVPLDDLQHLRILAAWLRPACLPPSQRALIRSQHLCELGLGETASPPGGSDPRWQIRCFFPWVVAEPEEHAGEGAKVRGGAAAFPVVDGGLGHIELRGQLLLGEAALDAPGSDVVPDAGKLSRVALWRRQRGG